MSIYNKITAGFSLGTSSPVPAGIEDVIYIFNQDDMSLTFDSANLNNSGNISEIGGNVNASLGITSSAFTYAFAASSMRLASSGAFTFNVAGIDQLVINSLGIKLPTQNITGNQNGSVLKFTDNSGGVNQLTIANAVAGSIPAVSATGSDANISLNLNAKGTGTVNVVTPASNVSSNQVVNGQWVNNYFAQLPSRTAIADANYTTSGSDYLIAFTSLTASRTVTLSVITGATSASPKFQIIKDETGSAATNNIVINAPSGKTIDGVSSLVLNTNYGVLKIYYNGTNFFTAY